MTEPRHPETPWYVGAFDHLYPLLYSHRDDEAAQEEAEQLVRLFRLSVRDATVLDLCCGGGRHAAAFSRMGFPVWGTDLSFRLLADANSRPELRGRVANAEIRSLPFFGAFDLVLNLFTSFGYFPEDEENTRALREMVRVLRPGGRLVLDHMNRAGVERGLVEEDEQSRGDIRIRQRRWIDKNRILKRIEVVDGNGRHITLLEDVRLYTPEEMRDLLVSAGLTEIRLFGSFAGERLTPESERMIASGIKRKGKAR